MSDESITDIKLEQDMVVIQGKWTVLRSSYLALEGKTELLDATGAGPLRALARGGTFGGALVINMGNDFGEGVAVESDFRVAKKLDVFKNSTFYESTLMHKDLQVSEDLKVLGNGKFSNAIVAKDIFLPKSPTPSKEVGKKAPKKYLTYSLAQKVKQLEKEVELLKVKVAKLESTPP